MDKQSLIRDIRAATGGKSGMISQKQASEYMGIHENNIRPVLEGVPYVTTGRTKRYLIGDIAERILETRRY